jgi:hypothetical protein
MLRNSQIAERRVASQEGLSCMELMALYRKHQATGLKKKCIYSTYSPPELHTHLRLRCSNFFNPSKKNSFVCAANRKIENWKRPRLISTTTYRQALNVSCTQTHVIPFVGYLRTYSLWRPRNVGQSHVI